jgi:hypothetical protein
MLSVVKLISLFAGVVVANLACAKDLNFLLIGGDVASACSVSAEAQGYDALQMYANGKITLNRGEYSVGCTSENAWTDLGKKLVTNYRVDKITIFAVNKSNLTIEDLWGNTPIKAKLDAIVAMANQNHLRFDYVLWQQGEASTNDSYLFKISNLMRIIGGKVKIDKWLVARNSGCGGVVSKETLDAQDEAGNNPLFSRYPGPDLDALGRQYRRDDCRFTREGEKKLTELWYEALVKADREYKIYQRETLLYYFK